MGLPSSLSIPSLRAWLYEEVRTWLYTQAAFAISSQYHLAWEPGEPTPENTPQITWNLAFNPNLLEPATEDRNLSLEQRTLLEPTP
jgi:hypothetical protein